MNSQSDCRIQLPEEKTGLQRIQISCTDASACNTGMQFEKRSILLKITPKKPQKNPKKTQHNTALQPDLRKTED